MGARSEAFSKVTLRTGLEPTDAAPRSPRREAAPEAASHQPDSSPSASAGEGSMEGHPLEAWGPGPPQKRMFLFSRASKTCVSFRVTSGQL